MSSRASGSGLTGTWRYNDGTAGNQRLFEAHVWNGANALSALQTSWDGAGNLTRRTNWALPGGGVEDLVFGYDNRNRLVSAATTSGGYGGGYSASYAYDASGRMTLKDEPGAAVTMTYTGSGPVHAPKTVNGQPMQYDAHGNLTSGRGRSFTYDGLQRTKTVTANGLTTTSWYDADGRPVLRDELTSSGTVTKTLLVDQLFEVDVTPNGANAGATTSYYFFGGQRVAQRGQTTGSAPTLRFLHGDHLGSQSLVTDSSGGEVSRVSYLPYGGTRLGSQTGAFGFTDQRLERQHGLHYYGNQTGYGRFYDSGIGAWTQPDSVTPGRNAVAWNRFAYVAGNPLRSGDPNGHCPTCATQSMGLAGGGARDDARYEDEAEDRDPCYIRAGTTCLVFEPAPGPFGQLQLQVRPYDRELADATVTLGELLAGGALAAGWLKRHEGKMLGHTIDRHVGKSLASLRERLEKMMAYQFKKFGDTKAGASSFYSEADAEKWISETMRLNRDTIRAWQRKSKPGQRLTISHPGTNGQTTGYGYHYSDPQNATEFNGVTVVLEADKSGQGYFIVTSYPTK